MVGHGSPQKAPEPATPVRKVGVARAPGRPRMLLAALSLILLGPASLTAAGLDVRLRITWGSAASGREAARHWSGVFELSDGTFSDIRRLGFEALAPTSVVNAGDKLHIWQPAPARFDGIDVGIVGAEETKLTIKLRPDRNDPEVRELAIPLEPFTAEQGYGQNLKLDDQGNSLIIRRAPGDHLRVAYDRDSLVFAPREKWTIEVQPHRMGFAPGTSLRGSLQLVHSVTGEETWSQEHDLQTDEQGSADAIGPLTIEVPQDEGVYDLVVSVRQRRFAASLLLQRKVQIIVLDAQAPPADVSAWREVDEVQPSNPKWWERWTWLSQLKLPGAQQGPLDNGKLTEVTHEGERLTQLAAGGWQAAPLPVSRIGLPHLLEVEFPADVPQTFGISILQPNAAGEVSALGVDSGVDVAIAPGATAAGFQKHRLVFWPRTRAPWLLLTNRQEHAPARIGKIRVLAGPSRLPESMAARGGHGRMVAAYFDKPFFAENFSAAEALDPLPHRSLDDWQTFHDGGQRLADYLKYVGYNAAIISVVRDGGTLYPSRHLDSTPRHDSGVLFVSGQDPTQKDVLEMLLRIFDREELKLVPAIHLSTPLPALESLRRQPGVDSTGIELLGPEGLPWSARRGTNRGQSPYYNILDERVQEAIRNVVTEIRDRYGHHDSFAGITLQLGPDTYVQLPETSWGNDDRTFANFVADHEEELRRLGDEAQLSFVASGAGRFAARDDLLTRAGRQLWLEWRARRLTSFYSTLQRDLAQTKPDARLYLATADLLTRGPLHRELYPRLPARGDLADSLLQHGLDVELLKAVQGLVLLRPQRQRPLTSLADQAVNIQLRRLREFDELFRKQRIAGALTVHEAMTMALPSFDAKSPFGADKTSTWLAALVPPSGAQSRARLVHAIAALDAQVVVEGGGMLPLGQEDAVREQVAAFRMLPEERFQTVTPRAQDSQTSSVVMRTLSRDQRTYFYLVNDAPWAVDVDVDFNTIPQATLQRLGADTAEQLVSARGRKTWSVSLQPYDLVAGFVSDPRATVEAWHARYEPGIKQRLATRVEDVKVRINELERLRPLAGVANGGFEETDASGSPLQWSFLEASGATVRVDSDQPLGGEHALHIRNDGTRTVWVRSQPLPVPKTGRMSVLAWIRTSDADQQPNLRLAIDDGRGYYRFATLGKELDGWAMKPGKQTEPLTSDWPAQPYLLHITDLPSSGIGNLMIGFDLIGAGEVWIDEVQVFDLYFEPDELKELIKEMATVHFQLDEGRVAECEQFLSGYWPRFVVEHVPISKVVPSPVPQPPRTATRAENAAPAPSPEQQNSGWRRYLPTWQLPFRR